MIDIPRVSIPGPKEFFERYLYARRPVVITDLFAGQDVSDIATIDDAIDAWGQMSIRVQDEYTSAEATNGAPEPTAMHFREYVELTRANPSTRHCCTEYDTPARVLASFRLPELCLVSSPPEDEIFGLPKKYGDFDLATHVFVANEGNVAHLHFDGDQREVLLHQIYGRKRVLVFPPMAAIHLRTLDGPFSRPSLAGVYPEDMELDEKLALVERAGGWHTVLEPGETLYIPMLMWHHVEYLEDAMSFNIRFARTRYGRFLSLDNFHRDPYIQNVASKLVGPEAVLEQFGPAIEEVKAVYRQAASDLHRKVREVRALFRRLCAELAPEACAEQLCPPAREEEQITRIVEGNDMAGGLKYADPAAIAKTRPVGPIADRQREILARGLASHGYSSDVEAAVIFNKLGKRTLDELTKAEAAQLIAYLRTPGATW